MKQRKIPLRKCVGCKEQKAKDQLIRIVKNKENEIFIDTVGKANGRGVYICNSKECLDKAINNNEIQRSLKCKIDEVVIDELYNMID